MSESYQHLTTEELQSLYTAYRQNLADLEAKKAKFGSLHVPTPITNEIRDIQANLSNIDQELKQRHAPKESVRQGSESRDDYLYRHYIQAAEAHKKIGNSSKAIESYTHAIAMLPTAELFLARAMVHLQNNDRDYEEIFSDIENAIKLSNSIDFEKEARFFRVKFITKHYIFRPAKFWDDDVSWLEKILNGRDLGELIFLKIYYSRSSLISFDGNPQEAIIKLEQAIKYGYRDSEVYYFRSAANYHLSKLTQSFEDIEIAIQTCNDDAEKSRYESFKAFLFSSSGDFNQAYLTYKQINPDYINYHDSTGDTLTKLVCKIALEYKFFGEYFDNDSYKLIEAAVDYDREILTPIKKKYPEVWNILSEMGFVLREDSP